MQKKIYIIGIGGIGVSAIARYYNENNYKVYGSDSTNSELIETLKNEGIDIIIGTNEDRINSSIDLIVYTEAIPEFQSEIKKARNIGIKTLTYPKALALIANNKKLIAVAGTHGKSTTSSMGAIMLQKSELGVNAVVGTLLKEFNGKNTFFSDSEYFIIEACEYKRAFLNYTPYIGIITNIEIDHLDYYKDLDDYFSAYKKFIDNIKSGGYVILNGEDSNCRLLVGLRKDIHYLEVYKNYFTMNNKIINYNKIDMQIPGSHILYDAHVIYCLGNILGLENIFIIYCLENYTGVWRRMEKIGQTMNGNIVISDYGHHPTEIKLTLKALKEKYIEKKIFVIFQPHQYNRTIELLDGFKDSFVDVDKIIIPNIYESRDSQDDKEKMSTEILLRNINHNNKKNGKGLENTRKLIEKYDNENYNNSIIILMGAGDVDNLRYDLFQK